MKTAYFQFLNPPENLDPELIVKILCEMSKTYDRIKPASEYDPDLHDPRDYSHRFVVWRFHRDDTIPDQEAIKLVGKEGNLFYRWICRRCGYTVSKTEYPGNHREDTYFGCDCPDTRWGVAIA
jgi:hypothetical protein